MQSSAIPSFRLGLVLLVATCAVTGTKSIQRAESQEKQPTASDKHVRDARRKAMRQLAESFQVIRGTENGEQVCKLHENCVVYFTDAVFHPEIGEGSTWIWHDNEVPQAIAQVYYWPPIDKWVMGIYTFSFDPLIFDDGDSIKREYRKTDFQPQVIPDAPAPASTEAARLLQMKQLARRFSAYERRPERKDPKRTRCDLRLLPQPIYHYSGKSSGILDGAIFAFVHGGTNAQIVMLLEAREQDEESTRWTVGFGRLSDGDNYVQLDDRQFWTEPSPPRPLPPDFPSNYISKRVPWTVEEER